MKNTETVIGKENAIKVNAEWLANLLKGITKSTICNITYMVDDTRSKQIKGQKQVQKLVEISHVYLNHDYQNKVNNLNSTTDWKAEELKGKTRISSTLLQSDKTGAWMIDGKVLNSESAKILSFWNEGKEISEEWAVNNNLWAGAYYNPKPKTTMGRGTVSAEDDFRIINTYLSRIVWIKIESQWYEITE